MPSEEEGRIRHYLDLINQGLMGREQILGILGIPEEPVAPQPQLPQIEVVSGSTMAMNIPLVQRGIPNANQDMFAERVRIEDFQIGDPVYVGTIPPRRDAQVLPIEFVDLTLAPLTPTIENMEVLQDKLQTLEAERVVLYKTINDQQEQINALKQQRDAFLTHPIFRRTLPKL